MRISRQLFLLALLNGLALSLAIVLCFLRLSDLREGFLAVKHDQTILYQLTEIKATALEQSRADFLSADIEQQLARSDKLILARLDALRPAQRLFNAIEPGSYVQPHRHLNPVRDETLLMLRGRLGLILFDDAGSVTRTVILSPASDCLGFHLAPELWHSVVALESGSIFFEAKDGPYQPAGESDRAPWAPAENTPDAANYQQSLRALFPA